MQIEGCQREALGIQRRRCMNRIKGRRKGRPAGARPLAGNTQRPRHSDPRLEHPARSGPGPQRFPAAGWRGYRRLHPALARSSSCTQSNNTPQLPPAGPRLATRDHHRHRGSVGKIGSSFLATHPRTDDASGQEALHTAFRKDCQQRSSPGGSRNMHHKQSQVG